MIVKIPMTVEGKQTWWLYDGLTRVHYARDHCSIEDAEKVDDFTLCLLDDDGQKVAASLCCLHGSSNREIFILFNTVAYICNDNGDTVEVIRAHPQN